jgi:hypothetical protein
MTIVKVKGKTVNLNGADYVIPPLNLRALEQLQDKLTTFGGAPSLENMGIVADIAHAALKRNYPDMTRDEVADLIDFGNMTEVMEAVMNVSGLTAQSDAPGEATGAAKA